MSTDVNPFCFGHYKKTAPELTRICDCCPVGESCCAATPAHYELPVTVGAADVMEDMAKTFRERNAVYGDNYKMVGKLMAVLFPNGAPAEILHSDQFHLFELKLVKLSRFAISGLQHLDSIHDDGVYSAMIEAILKNKEQKQ